MTVRELREVLSRCDPDMVLNYREDSHPSGVVSRDPMGTIAHMGGVMSVPFDFHWSWHQMVKYNAEFLENKSQFIHYSYPKVSHHATARNLMTKTYLGDWLLMMDTDHGFEPDIVSRMLTILNKYPDVDVLSALYRSKEPPYGPNVYWWDYELEAYTFVDQVPSDLELWGGEEFASGAGCLLIRRHVLDRIENELHEYPFDELPGYKHCKFTNQFTEDLSFFIRCRKLGVKSFVAPRIESFHLMTQRIKHTESPELIGA